MLASTHSLYRRWQSMTKRCRDRNCKSYKHYGGRNISVDPMWLHFWTFAFDMGMPPSPQHSLDRRDNDGPYAPWNCRWATFTEQKLNSRRSLNKPPECGRGHPLSGDNLYIHPTRGTRCCKACNCLAVRRYKDRTP